MMLTQFCTNHFDSQGFVYHVTDALSIHDVKQDLIFQTSNGNLKSYNETINILRVADFIKSTVFKCLNEAVRADMGSYGHETSGD